MRVNLIGSIRMHEPVLDPIHRELVNRGHEVIVTMNYETPVKVDALVMCNHPVQFNENWDTYRFHIVHGVSILKPWTAMKAVNYQVCPTRLWEDEILFRREFLSKDKFHPDMYPVTLGWSKTDVLSLKAGASDDIRELVCEKYELDYDKPIVLYAPTVNESHWEYGRTHHINLVHHLLADDYQLIITKHELDDTGELSESYIPSDGWGFMDLQVASDILVTDIGSVLFEYCLLDKPIVLIKNPNVPGFFRCRMYTCRQTVDVGKQVLVDDVLQAVDNALEKPDEYREQRKFWFDFVVGKADGKNAERFVDFLETKTE